VHRVLARCGGDCSDEGAPEEEPAECIVRPPERNDDRDRKYSHLEHQVGPERAGEDVEIAVQRREEPGDGHQSGGREGRRCHDRGRCSAPRHVRILRGQSGS